MAGTRLVTDGSVHLDPRPGTGGYVVRRVLGERAAEIRRYNTLEDSTPFDVLARVPCSPLPDAAVLPMADGSLMIAMGSAEGFRESGEDRIDLYHVTDSGDVRRTATLNVPFSGFQKNLVRRPSGGAWLAISTRRKGVVIYALDASGAVDGAPHKSFVPFENESRIHAFRDGFVHVEPTQHLGVQLSVSDGERTLLANQEIGGLGRGHSILADADGKRFWVGYEGRPGSFELCRLRALDFGEDCERVLLETREARPVIPAPRPSPPSLHPLSRERFVSRVRLRYLRGVATTPPDLLSFSGSAARGEFFCASGQGDMHAVVWAKDALVALSFDRRSSTRVASPPGKVNPLLDSSRRSLRSIAKRVSAMIPFASCAVWIEDAESSHTLPIDAPIDGMDQLLEYVVDVSSLGRLALSGPIEEWLWALLDDQRAMRLFETPTPHSLTSEQADIFLVGRPRASEALSRSLAALGFHLPSERDYAS
ncbi:MAG: hypothetical protein U0271_24810 [Polyangiaceae bacterium]